MRRLNFLLLALGLVLSGGCSGEPAPPAATAEPAFNDPLNLNQSVENAEWLAPYLSDEVRSVTIVDVRKLGPLWTVATSYLATTSIDGLPDLSQIEAGAFLMGEPTSDSPENPIGGLLRLKSPPSPEFIQDCKAKLRGMMGMPESEEEFAQTMAQLGPELVAEMMPKVEANGRTLIIGLGQSFDRLKARPAGNAAMAAALRSLGDHAYVTYAVVGDAVRAAIEAARALGQEDTAHNPAADLHNNLAELFMASRAFSGVADITPRLYFHAVAVPEDAAQLPALKTKAQAMIDEAKTRMQAEWARVSSPQLPTDLAAQVITDILDQGTLSAEGGILRFRYESTPEVSAKLLASIPDALAEDTRAKQHALQVLFRGLKLRDLAGNLIAFAHDHDLRLPGNIMGADGKPLMSWRVAMLPSMKHGYIYEQLKLDEPWDSAHNAPLLKQVASGLFAAHPNTPEGHADLLAVIGDKFGFSPQESTAEGAGTVSMGSVTDGMGQTAFVVEVDPARSVPWAKPEDYTWNPDKPTEGLGAPDDDFFYAMLGDGRALKISKDESADTLRAIFGRSDGQKWELKPIAVQAWQPNPHLFPHE